VRRLATIAAMLLLACSRGEDGGQFGAGDSLGSDGLALPPSARAPRAPQPGGSPDTVVPGAPDDTLASEGTVGPIPLPVLDVGAVANAYRRFYGEIYAEMGSSVRGSVDPELVEEAKHRTALEFGYVDVNAWNDMLADLNGAQRSELSQRIAAMNRDLAAELHGA
jgi:hypothetical protein